MAVARMFSDMGKLAHSLGQAIQEVGTYSQNAAAKANAISAASQSAQGAFNQASADNANTLNMGAMANQYGFNSAMMQQANDYNTNAWNQAAIYNSEMWEKQAAYNREEAEKQRAWQTQMANTQYQRAIKDMEKAGLNPVLAVTGGGVGTSVPGGAVASSGLSGMSAANANMASGGLLGASSASESNYMGQMEQMGTTLALLGAIFSGISSAAGAAGGLGEAGETVMNAVTGAMFGNENGSKAYDIGKSTYEGWKRQTEKYGFNKGTLNTIYGAGKAAYKSFFGNNGSREFQFRSGHAKG